MIYSPLVSIQSTLKRYQLLQRYATILWEMDFHKSVYIYRYTMFLGHCDRRCHTHMHMYTCMEDVCHTCSSLELASAGKYQATAGVESVYVECVCVCATTKIMHRILRCGTIHNI